MSNYEEGFETVKFREPGHLIVFKFVTTINFSTSQMEATDNFLSRKALHQNEQLFQPIFQDLQGNILKSHGRTFVALLFLRFTDKKRSREWLAGFHPKVTSFATQLEQTKKFKEALKKEPTEGEIFINLMFSHQGYLSLGINPASIPTDSKFRKGMANRGRKLNDPPVSEWESAFKAYPIHAAILIAHNNENYLQNEVAHITDDLNTNAINLLGTQYGKRRFRELHETVNQTNQVHFPDYHAAPNENYPERDNIAKIDIEPFGYADGVSQPLFLHEDIEKYQLVQYTKRFWDPAVEVGVVLVPDEGSSDSRSYGSYCVLRKLEQDVPGFNQAVDQLADHLGITPSLAGAQIVGRFKDGTPIALNDHPLGTLPQNNFNYEGDFRGRYCPLFAHIRKANPRSALFNKRIARRAIPYEEQTPEGKKKEGLVFMSMQATLAQFETIQASWINGEHFPPIPPHKIGTDPLIGRPPTDNRFSQEWGTKPPDARNVGRFVTLKGGEYFFLPSKTTLQNIATNNI